MPPRRLLWLRGVMFMRCLSGYLSIAFLQCNLTNTLREFFFSSFFQIWLYRPQGLQTFDLSLEWGLIPGWGGVGGVDLCLIEVFWSLFKGALRGFGEDIWTRTKRWSSLFFKDSAAFLISNSVLGDLIFLWEQHVYPLVSLRCVTTSKIL